MLQGLKRKLTTYFSPEIQKTIKPQTYAIDSGGDKPKFFGEKRRNKKRIEEYIRIYEQGGLISEAIDLHPLFMFSKGFSWVGDPGSIDLCKEFMDGFDYEYAFNMAVTAPLVCADGFEEIVQGRGGKIVGLLYRDPRYWKINYDQYGLVSGYTQSNSNIFLNKEQTFNPNQIFHTQMIPSLREGYGTSLIQRAIDDITRDAKIAEGSANAIERHGTPKWEAAVGVSGSPVADSVITDITQKLTDLNSKNDIVHHRDITISSLDTSGVGNIGSYQDFALVRVCAAMGVPGELLGFRQGTTDNTAVSRIGAFLQKCDTFNRRFARALNVQVFDQITGKPGAAKIEFNSVMPSQQTEMATWIVNLIKANPLDPEAYCPTEWVRQVLGIPDKIEETKRESESLDYRRRKFGGPGSGNFGHAGRPGEVGGSGEGGSAEEVSSAIIAGIQDERNKEDYYDIAEDSESKISEDAINYGIEAYNGDLEWMGSDEYYLGNIALQEYCDNEYEAINENLRGDHHSGYKAHEKVIDRIIEDSPNLSDGIEMYRGVGANSGKSVANADIGDTIQDAAYQSHSLNPATAGSFTKEWSDEDGKTNRTVIRAITTGMDKGIYINNEKHGESEVIISRDTSWKIVNKEAFTNSDDDSLLHVITVVKSND